MLKVETQLWENFRGLLDDVKSLPEVTDAFKRQLGLKTRRDLTELLKKINAIKNESLKNKC